MSNRVYFECERSLLDISDPKDILLAFNPKYEDLCSYFIFWLGLIFNFIIFSYLDSLLYIEVKLFLLELLALDLLLFCAELTLLVDLLNEGFIEFLDDEWSLLLAGKQKLTLFGVQLILLFLSDVKFLLGSGFYFRAEAGLDFYF